MSSKHVLRVDLIRPDKPLELYKFDGQPQRYLLLGSNGALGEAKLDWPEVLGYLDELTESRQPTTIGKPLGLKLRQFLEDAFKSLQGWECVEQALREAEERKQRLHLVFGFRAVELFALPWLLTQLRNGEPLGLHGYCIPQFEWTGEEPVDSSPPREGRLLFAWSEAGDLVPDEDPRRVLKETWPDFRPERDELEDVTLDKLKKALKKAEQDGQPVRILHILCHGSAMADSTFGLVWSAPASRGGQGAVDGESLARILAPHKRSLRLVVLAACHGANPGRPGRMFGGVAHDLHRLGIPFVIASQMPLSCEGSIQVAQAFYRELGSGSASVHDAFKAAQSAVNHLFRDWASLQLFTVSSVAPGLDRRLLRRSHRTAFSGKRTLPKLEAEALAFAYEVNDLVPSPRILGALNGEFPQEPDVVALQPLGRTGDGLPATKAEWKKTFTEAEDFVKSLKEAEQEARSEPRLLLFGRAPLPLMFHLGWLLGRHPLRVYQERRDQGNTWSCGHDSSITVDGEEPFLQVASWPDREACRAAGGRVAVAVEVTLRANEADLDRWLKDTGRPALIRLTPLGGASPEAVMGPADAARAVRDFRACLDRIHAELPEAREVWLALACPASLAAALGRAFNPKSQAPLKLFNYRPREGYLEVKTLDDRVGVRR